MGDLSTALVIFTTSFLLGILSMHWTVDHLVLWQSPVTRTSLLSAHAYYVNTLLRMPSAFQTSLYVVATSGAALLVFKVLGGKESNWLFDGASLFLYGAVALVQLQKVVPSLEALPSLTPLPAANPDNPRDALLVPLRELASSNAVQAAALVGILILQSGQYYSERLERRERVEELEAKLRRRRRRLERQQNQRGTQTETATTATTSTLV